MRKLLTALIGAAALSVGSAATAQITFVQNGPTGIFFSGVVGCTGDAPCSFTESGSFIPVGDYDIVSATITSVADEVGDETDINFTSVLLNGVGFNLDPSGATEYGELLDQPLLAGANTIVVNGTTGGNASFSGTLAFGTAAAPAVPEPGTWGMMLLGFGAAGFAMRKSRKARSLMQIA